MVVVVVVVMVVVVVVVVEIVVFKFRKLQAAPRNNIVVAVVHLKVKRKQYSNKITQKISLKVLNVTRFFGI